MNVIDKGTFVYGDTGTDLILTIEDEDGVVIDLTGATAIALVCRSAGRDVGEIEGSISGAPELGVLLFEDVGTAFTPTSSRPRLDFVGRVRWSQSGELHYTRDAVKFAIELFP